MRGEYIEMKFNKKREEFKDNALEAKRIWRKIYRLQTYGGSRNEDIRQNKRKKGI